MPPEGATVSSNRTTLRNLSIPAKALVTAIIITLNIAMIGAMGQIIVHDIIPTFFSNTPETDAPSHSTEMEHHDEATTNPQANERGDLFTDITAVEVVAKPFYQNEQFIWTLKWTHIHLFGINMIFIFVGGITLFLDLGEKTRTWLIILPFAGILIDIATVWLKGFISPAFFWLHIPGGCLFGVIFAFVTLRALWELWIYKERPA